MNRPDAELIKSEIRNGAAMLKHACRAGRWRIKSSLGNRDVLASELRGIVAEHRRLWLARNRPGGLDDTAKRLENRLKTL